MTEVTCAIIMKDNKVLLTQRSETMSHPLQWEFPGGKVKPGETPEKCLIREIREELHAEVDIEQLLPSVVHNYGSGSIKLIPFICTMQSDQIRLEQHKAYRWIAREELSCFDLLEADREIIAEMNGR
jgi:8-oxo-dGTP diphosphatase